MSIASPEIPQRSDLSYRNPIYRWYVVIILLLIYACHSLDRGMPNIVVEPVRHEFGLSDSQLGLFSGLAFGVSFAIAGLPMGYLSDRLNRRKMLSVIIVIWSVCTALGGAARNYLQLVLSRVGVGIGEAGAAPIAMPMLSDIFPPNRRAFAMGIFYMSVPLGTFGASVAGGYIAAEYGWRTAFLVAGIPGILLALLTYLTVKEPVRGATDDESSPASKTKSANLKEVGLFLCRKPALLCLMLGCSFIGLVSITFGAWIGSFFIRIHDVGLKEVGLILGVGTGLCGMASTTLFGWTASKLAPLDPRWPLRIVWVASLFSVAAGLAMLFTPFLWIAIVGYVLMGITSSGYPPPTYSVLMANTPAHMRGTVMSVLQLTTNLVGFGLGPVVTGFLSDLYGGDTAIRYALANALMIKFAVVGLLIASSIMLFGRNGKKVAAPQSL